MSRLGALKGHEKQNAVIFPFYHFEAVNCTSTKFVLALGLYMDLVPNVGQSRRVEKDRELKPGVYSSGQDGFHGRSAQFSIQ
jgi:hypothetical protein